MPAMRASFATHWLNDSGTRMNSRLYVAAFSLALAGCVPAYTLKEAGTTPVARGAFVVQPSTAWNGVPRSPDRTPWEEVWTQNGPLLESLSFVGALPDGKALVVQRKKAQQRVPPFRANMSPDDLVSMIEASYRTRGVTVFTVGAVDPVEFLGGPGIRIRFNYAPSNGITQEGSCVMRILDEKLYLMKLDGVSIHYFEAAFPEFERLIASARLK
jgi:hypothetical protein